MSEKYPTAREQYFHPDDPAGWLGPNEPFMVDGLDWSWTFVVYKGIPGFPAYCAGTNGSIWSRWTKTCIGRHRGTRPVIGHSWKRKKPYLRPDGKLQVVLSEGGKKYHPLVHQLILKTFVGPCPPGMECCHRDDNGSNNALTNLRWDSRLANMVDRHRNGRVVQGEYSSCSKLTVARVRSIRREYAAGGISQKALAVKHGVSQGTVNRVVNRKNWSHVERIEVEENP